MSILTGTAAPGSAARSRHAEAPAPPAPAASPSYELVITERGMDGEIKRMILRPLSKGEAAGAVPVSLREAR